MSDDKETTSESAGATPDAAAEQQTPSAPVSRRAALKVLGVVPIAGALGAGTAWAHPAPPHAAHPHPAPPQAQQQKRAFFTAAEWRTVSVLSDDIIPRDARSGSATDVGVPAYIDFQLSVPETSESERYAIRGGLAWLNTESRKRFGKNYASLGESQRHQILDDIAYPDKVKPGFTQGAAFFSRMRDFVGSGFFSTAVGWKDLRYEGNVFNPDWQGCPESAMKKLGVSHAVMNTRIPVE